MALLHIFQRTGRDVYSGHIAARAGIQREPELVRYWLSSRLQMRRIPKPLIEAPISVANDVLSHHRQAAYDLSWRSSLGNRRQILNREA